MITSDLGCKGETLQGDYLKSDRKALLHFKSGLKGSSTRLSSWIGGNYCQWEGISCENNTNVVISINLRNSYPLKEIFENWSSMNLSGEIRPSLLELKYLRYLDLSRNTFENIPIPKFFGSLKNFLFLLFIAFVCISFSVWDRQTLVREQEVNLFKENGGKKINRL